MSSSPLHTHLLLFSPYIHSFSQPLSPWWLPWPQTLGTSELIWEQFPNKLAIHIYLHEYIYLCKCKKRKEIHSIYQTEWAKPLLSKGHLCPQIAGDKELASMIGEGEEVERLSKKETRQGWPDNVHIGRKSWPLESGFLVFLGLQSRLIHLAWALGETMQIKSIYFSPIHKMGDYTPFKSDHVFS